MKKIYGWAIENKSRFLKNKIWQDDYGLLCIYASEKDAKLQYDNEQEIIVKVLITPIKRKKR